MTVTRNTIIAEILQNDPSQGCVPIFLNTGMHCLGCMAAHGETVEQACMVHGVDPDELCAELNDYFAHLYRTWMRGWPPRLPMCGPAILPPILGVTMENSVHGWRAAVAARLFLHVICGKARCKKPA